MYSSILGQFSKAGTRSLEIERGSERRKKAEHFYKETNGVPREMGNVTSEQKEGKRHAAVPIRTK